MQHIAGGAFFVSNFLFANEIGYFDGPAETKPLLHLWSLAIEEQFYIFLAPFAYAAVKEAYIHYICNFCNFYLIVNW